MKKTPGNPQTCLVIDSHDWTYVAEGGSSVVVRHCGSIGDHAGYALRIPKLLCGLPSSSYERDTIAPLLGNQYLDTSATVELEGESLSQLENAIKCHRPTARLNACTTPLCRGPAILTRDKTQLWLPRCRCVLSTTQSLLTAATIALELKPKWASMPRSLLVPPDYAQLKCSTPRFEAIQTYKLHMEAAGVEEPWGCMGSETAYRPTDLFSGQLSSIKLALEALHEQPHNKFRIFAEGHEVLSNGSSRGGIAQTLETTCRKALNLSTAGMLDLASEVLYREPLLSRLLSAQRLDILEVEGAVFVFARLQSLLPLNTPDATNDRILLELDKPMGDIDAWLAQWKDTLFVEEPSQLSRHERERMRKKAVASVNEMSEGDCARLLVAWLTSQTVADCSIMLALAPACSTCEIVEERQQKESAGRLRNFAYSLCVVDVGPKPPTCIQKQATREPKVWELVAKLASQRSKDSMFGNA